MPHLGYRTASGTDLIFDPRPDFATPKASSKVRVVALPKFEPGKWAVFGACGKCANAKEPQKRSEIGTRFWHRFSHKLALSSELFNLENSKQNGREQKPREVLTSYAELQLWRPLVHDHIFQRAFRAR